MCHNYGWKSRVEKPTQTWACWHVCTSNVQLCLWTNVWWRKTAISQIIYTTRSLWSNGAAQVLPSWGPHQTQVGLQQSIPARRVKGQGCHTPRLAQRPARHSAGHSSEIRKLPKVHKGLLCSIGLNGLCQMNAHSTVSQSYLRRDGSAVSLSRNWLKVA